MSEKERLRFPIQFEKLEEYENNDDRFTVILVKILHTGKNYNGSIFQKEVVDKAIPTLANTPILCYVEEYEEGNKDYSDHRYVFEEDENGEYHMVYKGQAIGTIPESFVNQAYYQDDLCSDGVTRTFLYCKAVVWNKLENGIDILEKFDGKSPHSCELGDTYSGHLTNDGFVFDSFSFYGCCLLGHDSSKVQPAMIDSEAKIINNSDFSKQDKNDIHFSSKDIAKEIENKLKEFEKIIFSNKNTQNDKEVEEKDMAKNKEDKKQEEIVVTDNAKEENKDVEAKAEDVKTDEPKENKAETDNAKTTEEENVEEVTKTDDSNVEENADDKKEGTEKDDKVETDNSKKQFSINFELSHDDIRSQLYNKLFDLEALENTCYGIEFVKNEYFVYFDYCNNQYFKQSYSVENEEVKFNGEREEIYSVFVDKATYDEISVKAYAKLKEELENANSQIAQFSKENKELKEFKAVKDEETRKSQIDNVLNKFSKVEGLNLEDYKTKAYNKEIALENLEGMIYQEIGKKNFSMTKVDEEVKENKLNYTVSINENEDACPYASLQQYFK